MLGLHLTLFVLPLALVAGVVVLAWRQGRQAHRRRGGPGPGEAP